MPCEATPSATTLPRAEELLKTATPGPCGSSWLATICAMSISCSVVSTRMTPDCRSIESSAPGGAWVVRTACPGGSCRPVTSDFATMTGLVRARRRAIRENFLGLPIDSK
ncbi:hypothetical protein MN0502_14010 [Arthrobacter sp. MN05-02]|nr:hypothetical protein MN0502_14010 [Arthrobacter sp. MN05-02]